MTRPWHQELIRPRRWRPIVRAGLAAVTLAGCAGRVDQSSRVTQSERAACRAHADEVFDRQNRDAVYRSDTYSTDLRDAPFGSSGMPGLPTFGLSQQFGVQTTMQNCLNGTGEPPATTDNAAPSAPPPLASSTRAPAAK